MISVPYEVKKALRDGMLRKNYRVVVDFQGWREVGEVPTTRYTPSHYTTDAKFVITDGDKYKFVVDDANSTSYQLYYCFTNYTSFEELSPTAANTWVLDNIPNNYAEVIVKSNNNYNSTVKVQTYIDEFTIDNDTLVSESVNIDERMCSGDTLKFGLCEGSSLEFQYFDHPNITGKRVQVFVDVTYGKQKRWVDYYDLSGSGEHSKVLTKDGVYQLVYTNGTAPIILTWVSGGNEYSYELPIQQVSTEFIIGPMQTGDSVSVRSQYECYAVLQSFENVDLTYSIPMGFFDVAKCSRQASTGIIKVTAYNKLMSDYLDAKANDEIIDIVSQGEEGNSTVSFYWILDKLLKDYSIEKYETSETYPDATDAELATDSTLEWWRQTHNGQVYEMCFPLYEGGSPNFKYLHICGFSLLMGGFQGWQQYYAKFLFNGEVAKNITETVYVPRNVDLNHNWLRSADSSTEFMTMRDFLLNGGWATMHAIASGGTYPMEMQKRYVGGLIEKDGNYLINLASDYKTDIHFVSGSSNVTFFLPYRAEVTSSTTNIGSIDDYKTYFRPLHQSFGWIYKNIELNIPESAMQRITLEQAEGFGDVTLRDIQSAVYETVCQFGQLSRITDLFSGVELNYGGLYPADTLYPANDLYPGGAVLSANKMMYSQLWADEGNVHRWRYLIITYKGLDEEQNEVDIVHQRTIDEHGTDDYNMSDNWLFRNLVWTEEQIDDYADAMIAKMQNHEWFPFEMWLAGLPYLETGDQIEIPLNGEVYTSYVLQRQLKGIQNLQDTYINGTLDIFS